MKRFFQDNKVFILGVLNITPDSFYDGGKYTDAATARERALQMASEGADGVDVGGESTRPGAKPVSLDEELRRVLPALAAIREAAPSLPISLDTSKAEVLRRAAAMKAVDLINDVTALSGDPAMAETAAEFGLPVLLTHMRGTPETMQRDPRYVDAVGEIRSYFEERIAWAGRRGIARDDILIDPGIGFGKTPQHNLQILNRLGELEELGCPVVVGPSRKSFIGKALGDETADRLWGTAAAVAAAVINGARGVRVHDVAAMRQVAALAWQIKHAN